MSRAMSAEALVSLTILTAIVTIWAVAAWVFG